MTMTSIQWIVQDLINQQSNLNKILYSLLRLLLKIKKIIFKKIKSILLTNNKIMI
jgi:hypothetical protein